MNVLVLIGACSIIFVVLHYCVIPPLERKANGKTANTLSWKFLGVVLLGFLRTTALTATLAYSMVWGILWFVQDTRFAAAPNVRDTFLRFKQWYDVFSQINSTLCGVFAAALMIVLLWLFVHVKAQAVIDKGALFTSPQGWLGRLATIFFSKGLAASLKHTSRIIFVMGQVLFFLSLLDANSNVVANALDSQLIRLEDLVVLQSEKEAESALAEYRRSNQPDRDNDGLPPTPPAEATDAVNYLAWLFERSLPLPPGLANGPGSTPIPGVVYDMAARQAILETVREHPIQGSVVYTYPALSRAEGINETERAVLESIQNSYSGYRPTSEAGRQFKTKAHSFLDSISVPLRNKILEKATSALNSFNQPLTTSDATTIVLQRAFGDAIGQIPGNGVVERIAKDLFRKLGQESIERVVRTTSSRFLVSLAKGQEPPEAARQLSMEIEGDILFKRSEERAFQGAIGAFPNADTIVSRLRRQPPGLYVEPRFEESATAHNAATSLRKALERSQGIAPTDIADSFATYEDWFPAQYAGETRTPQGRLLAEWNPAQFAVISPTEPSDSHNYSSAFRRSHSFQAVRGYARVGGVVIGRPPENTDNGALDFVGIRWHEEQGKLGSVPNVDISGSKVK